MSIEDFLSLVRQLPDVEEHPGQRYTTFRTHHHPFAYAWPRTQTVGLKQLLAEQLSLVAERPDVFEVQFTVGGFGWVVVRLDSIERTELAELTFEAWRLTAPAVVVEQLGERLPS